MGGFSMNKVLGTIKKRQTFIGSKGAFPCFRRDQTTNAWLLATGSAEEAPADPANDTPEDVAARSVV
jgi:hypothetical protein